MMESVGFVFGLVAFVWCLSLSNRITTLERIIKNAGIVDIEKEELKQVLKKNIGKSGKLDFESWKEDADIQNRVCTILDVDGEWVSLRVEKKNVEKLVRIEVIKSIDFTD